MNMASAPLAIATRAERPSCTPGQTTTLPSSAIMARSLAAALLTILLGGWVVDEVNSGHRWCSDMQTRDEKGEGERLGVTCFSMKDELGIDTRITPNWRCHRRQGTANRVSKYNLDSGQRRLSAPVLGPTEQAQLYIRRRLARKCLSVGRAGATFLQRQNHWGRRRGVSMPTFAESVSSGGAYICGGAFLRGTTPVDGGDRPRRRRLHSSRRSAWAERRIVPTPAPSEPRGLGGGRREGAISPPRERARYEITFTLRRDMRVSRPLRRRDAPPISGRLRDSCSVGW